MSRDQAARKGRRLIAEVNSAGRAQEFKALVGRVDAFLTAATQARAFRVQLWTHWQNAAQLEVYGKSGAHTLVDDAGVLQFLGAPNRRTAQKFVSLVGGIDADEIMAMGSHEQLVLMDGTPQRLRRFRYFEEECFAGQYDSVVSPSSRVRTERPCLNAEEGDVRPPTL